MGWLSGKGLPQRQEYGDKLRDDRMLLDSGRNCPCRQDRQAGCRAQRHEAAVAVAVGTAMPYASEEERRTAAERQLHETATAWAWAGEHDWEQGPAGCGREAPKPRTSPSMGWPCLRPELCCPPVQHLPPRRRRPTSLTRTWSWSWSWRS